MPRNNDSTSTIIKLLATRELDECLLSAAEVIIEETKATGLAILVWDADIESFSQTETFGESKKRMKALGEELINVYEDLDGGESTLDLSQFSEKARNGFDQVQIVRLRNRADLCAVLLVAGAKTEDVDAVLEKYPFAEAIYNAWSYGELSRENERLRSQYDELHNKIEDFERQTQNLIHDLTHRDSTRFKQVERDRLFYFISHSVRSSVRIQEVLSTIVEKICTTWSLSRTQLLRAESPERFEVYEYHAENVESVKDAFKTEEGLEFTRRALDVKSPLYIDPTVDGTGFDRSFLEQIGMRSGLIVPLIMRDHALGAVFLQDCEQAREWSIDDISLLGSLADQLAVAIENAELHMVVERQAVTDGLTGVANRRSFNESLVKEFERAKRYDQPLSLAVVDLDFLKKINDTYGHMTGDEAIKAIGTVLAQFSRVTDITARYGGEEFCVLLPNTDIEMAEQLAERLRRLIRETIIDGPGALSASIGVASFPLHADGAETLFLRADEALYHAKQDGRNRVKVSTLGPDGQPISPARPGTQPGSQPGSQQSLVQEKS